MTVPTSGRAARSISRWQGGAAAPSRRYRLYCCDLPGITPGRFGGRTVQVLAVSGPGSPVTVAAEHHAVRHARAGDAGDAAHGAGEPPVVELQGPGQVGATSAVGAVPFGGQGGQFPDGVDVAGPAFRQFVAAVVLAQHGVGPPPQVDQPRVVRVAIQADPVRSGRPARGGGLQRVSNGLGQILEPGGQVQVGAEPGLVEPGVAVPELEAQ